MTKEEIKRMIEELMRKYDREEIDGPTYMKKMLELNELVQNHKDDE